MDKAINILVISEEKDSSTNSVLKWIKYLGGTYLRINNTSKLKFISSELSDDFDDVIFEFKEVIYKMSDFTGYWYRRGRLNFNYSYFQFENIELEKSVNDMFNNEFTYLNNYIYYYIEKHRNINQIGAIGDNKTNKITNLLIAKKNNLKIPFTTIINTKEKLLEYKKEHLVLLTKPIYQRGLEYNDGDYNFSGLSAIIDDETIENLNETFSPTLIQAYVEKKYELRIFFLDDKYFASAIFSQNDEQTKIDFRNYNFKKPNRTVNFTLPIDIENKLKKCMSEIGLKSGSIDMIVTPDNEYVFLEVNPVGMFWQVSFPCNYNIEKEIAQFLCK